MDEFRSDAAQRLTRREVIRRGAVIGGVALWSAPLVRLVVTDGEARTMALAASSGTCVPRLLDDPHTVRLVCARTPRGAERSFRSALESACGNMCRQGGGCSVPTPCGIHKGKHGVTADTILCTETGNAAGCPPGSYARGAKEFSCVAVVTCNCECGR